MKTIAEILDQTIASSIQAILKNNGVVLLGASENTGYYDAVAVIGFSCESYGGVLGFAAKNSMIESAYGESNSAMSDSWLGELANQLVGRLKNALLAYGTEIQIALPMVLHGLELQVRQGTGQIRQYQYGTDAGSACVWVDADWEFSKEVELVEVDQHAKAEGEMTMF